MRKILILGGGNGGRRYIESLMWDFNLELVIACFNVSGKAKKLASDYCIKSISYDALTVDIVNVFDCIIVAVPPQYKLSVVKHIVCEFGYKGTLILEKPLCLSYCELYAYDELLKTVSRCAVVCQRDFFPDQYSIIPACEYDVQFPTQWVDSDFNLIHLMPHVLSMFSKYIGFTPILQRLGQNVYFGNVNGAKIRISFVSHGLSSTLQINNTVYPKLQYRMLNRIIVDKVCLFSKEETQENILRAFSVTKELIRLLER